MIDTTTHVEDRAGVPVTRRDLDELEEKLTSDAAGLGVWIATLEERIATLNGVWDLAAEALERQFEAERDFLRDALAERDTAIAALQRRVDQLDAERLGWLGELRQLGIRHDMLAERVEELESFDTGPTLDRLEADVAGLQRGLRNVADAHP